MFPPFERPSGPSPDGRFGLKTKKEGSRQKPTPLSLILPKFSLSEFSKLRGRAWRSPLLNFNRLPWLHGLDPDET